MMIFKRCQSLAPLLIFTLLSISCSNEKVPNSSEYEAANTMVSKGQYDIAIASMTEKVNRNPNDQQARVILASAYAARGGLYFRDYFMIIESVVAKIRQAEEYLEKDNLQIFNRIKNQVVNREQIDMVDAIEKSYRALYQANQIILIWNSLPTPTPAQIPDVRSAVMVLDYDQKLAGGQALYRGILRLILFKGEMKQTFKYAKINQCHLDESISQFLHELSTIRQAIVAILSDLAASAKSPRTKQDLQQMASKIDIDFARAIRAFGPLDKVNAASATPALLKALKDSGCNQ